MPTSSAISFAFCPRCGVEAATSVSSRRFHCAACGFDYFFNPAVAVAAFVFDAKDRVLLIRRAREPGRGKLAPPGGFVDAGERAETAVIREVREETGLMAESVDFLESQPNPYVYGGTTYPVLDLFFRARCGHGAETAGTGEVSEIVWRDAAKLAPEELAFPSMQTAWRHELRRHLGGHVCAAGPSSATENFLSSKPQTNSIHDPTAH